MVLQEIARNKLMCRCRSASVALCQPHTQCCLFLLFTRVVWLKSSSTSLRAADSQLAFHHLVELLPRQATSARGWSDVPAATLARRYEATQSPSTLHDLTAEYISTQARPRQHTETTQSVQLTFLGRCVVTAQAVADGPATTQSMRMVG